MANDIVETKASHALSVPGTPAIFSMAGMAELKARVKMIEEVAREIMQEDVHYGVIPGTGKGKDGKERKVLHKPGAELLATTFCLRPEFQGLDQVQDFEKGFFFYRYRCVLTNWQTSVTLGEGIGSCNSHEKKYRYRTGQRLCPVCGKETIIKGKNEYGGGWLCFKKNGGCGEKFADDDPAIIEQQVGQVANPEMGDLVNTIDKMAQKRALVAAVLIVVNASGLFTQDLEDFEEEPKARPVAKPQAEQQTKAEPEKREPAKEEPPHPSVRISEAVKGMGLSKFELLDFLRWASGNNKLLKSSELTDEQMTAIADELDVVITHAEGDYAEAKNIVRFGQKSPSFTSFEAVKIIEAYATSDDA